MVIGTELYIFADVCSSSETQGQIVGPKTKIKTGGKKFDEQKYERKIRAPGDKLFTHQFQTAERIPAPDWAEKFSAQSGASVGAKRRENLLP